MALQQSLHDALDLQRQQLVDIGKRNPLTNTPLGKSRTKHLEIVDELSEQVYKRLVSDNKKFTFLPHSKDTTGDPVSDDEDEVYIPTEVSESLHARHTDSKLQTALTPEALHKKLLSIFRESRRIQEEQGINVLYLALGFLKYYESDASSIARFGPLLLVPVDLDRSTVRSQFSLVRRDDDIEPNLSLTNLLSSDFEVQLPQFGDSGDESPSQYFDRIVNSMKWKDRWEVQQNRIVLGFFSFGKHRMFRDLELQASSVDGDCGLINKLLVGEDSEEVSGGHVSISAPTDEPLDKKYQNPKELGHILDADTSQTKVIGAVADGNDLVVQGPPGTGKSQTIANIVAVMAKQGKTVLFIAEKKAALDVVHRRLERAGLGPLCLELHSQKSNRRVVYEELRKTLELSEPKETAEQKYEEVRAVRDELNEVSNLLHHIDPETGNTPYLLMGRISELMGRKVPVQDFEFKGIETWSGEVFEAHLRSVRAYVAQAKEVGLERTHLWRGVHRRMNPANRIRFEKMLDDANHLGAKLVEDVEDAVKYSSSRHAHSLASVARSIDLVRLLSQQSPQWENALSNHVLYEQFQNLLELVNQIVNSQQIRQNLDNQLVSHAFSQSWELVLRDLTLHEKSIFRIFNGAFKRARQQLLSVLKIPVKNVADQIQITQELLSHELLVRNIESNKELGRAFFGLNWQEQHTDVEEINALFGWLNQVQDILGSNEELKEFLEINRELEGQDYQTKKLSEHLNRFDSLLTEMAEFAQIEWSTVCNQQSIKEFSLAQLNQRLTDWSANVEQLDGYLSLLALGNELTNRELESLRIQINEQTIPLDRAVDSFRLARAEAVFDKLANETPQIRKIDGADRTRKVELFARRDQELQRLAAQELARKHYVEIPRGQTGQLAILRGEMNKKSRHMTIRNLLSRAGEAIIQIKPVFLMSPLSVAQFLEPGILKFDVLLIDEASQVKPAEALGAVLRCKQIVVVGDQKQMPPTSFFDRQVSGEDDEEEDVSLGSQAAHMESILSLCDARAINRFMLRWHYRSEHPSLIEVSNHEFYESKLTYPPSPYAGIASSGLNLVKANGVYQRSKQRNNPIEGDVICEHVLQHVQNHPDQSLGIVALSVAQRDLIDNKVEFLRANNPEVDSFCSDTKEEPFFVKNLENVQGDERDVIYISIGYGKDQDGYFAQSFGPVSSEGGERRLNVLFTRARKKCTVFASISHEDIRVDVSAHAGPRVLKSYLKYAETGDMDIPMVTGEDFDSPFEQDVASVLLSHGFDVEGQVGTAGFKIDLVVKNPDDKDRYLLAIECDGARYHSSAWARERDRLRQQVLEGKGWRFHRIWSTDWFYNRETEIQKLLNAVDVARHSSKNGNGSPRNGDGNGVVREPTPTIERSEDSPPSIDESEIKTIPYIEANFDIPYAEFQNIHEANTADLVDLIHQIVEIEGPVHKDVVFARIVKLWGVKRLGSRIQETLEFALRVAVDAKRIAKTIEDGFLIELDAVSIQVRDRSSVDLSIVKDYENLPLSELQVGLVSIIQEGISVHRRECIEVLGKQLGYGRTTEGLVERITLAIDNSVEQGELREKDEVLRFSQRD